MEKYFFASVYYFNKGKHTLQKMPIVKVLLVCICISGCISQIIVSKPNESSFKVKPEFQNQTRVDKSLYENVTKWWEQIDHKNLKHSVPFTVLVVVLYLTVFLLGVVGNGFVILVIALRPRMRTPTNLFIFNLAVGDVFLLVVCLPATLLANILKSWILGATLCKGVTYVQGVSVVASVYSLVAITLDRCKTICQDSISVRGCSKSQAIGMILLIWLLAMLLPLPWTFVFEIHKSDSDGTTYCYENWHSKNVDLIYFLFVTLFLSYVLPVLLVSCSNVVIWWKVSHRSVPQPETSTSSPARALMQQVHQKTKQGVGRMLTVVTFAFLISWLPLYIVGTRIKLSSEISDEEQKALGVLVPISQWLGYLNSCMNPVLYAFFNATFRKMCKSILPSWVVQNCGAMCRQERANRAKFRMTVIYERSGRTRQEISDVYKNCSFLRRKNSDSSLYTLRQVIIDNNQEINVDGNCVTAV